MTMMSETAAALGIRPKKLASILKKTKIRMSKRGLSPTDLAVVFHYSKYGEMPPRVDDDDGTEGFSVEYLNNLTNNPYSSPNDSDEKHD
ncbi:hypothetical protein [Mycobacterium sp. Aquia_213]|uniref:hypothetical protein n=1 Tax=Mycobacterium sp. Aquia_213 TaxID=2991728 RepID=UPI00226DC350|nr:hypothetical protein [Mycobacterium sp. Aquia_213]WAC91151.1 hypothetical protein LMQ14_25320 [Mycobacterium sp. Aquia_213]